MKIRCFSTSIVLLMLFLTQCGVKPIEDSFNQNRHGLIIKQLSVMHKQKKFTTYLSLTTSPKRIHHLNEVLSQIDLSLVDGILVNLPFRFKRDAQTPYSLPDFLDKNSPNAANYLHKVKFLRSPLDYGPGTKVIPGFQYALDHHPKQLDSTFVISIDDDHKYPEDIVAVLLLSHFLYKQRTKKLACVGGCGQNLTFWGIFESFPFDFFRGSVEPSLDDSDPHFRTHSFKLHARSRFNHYQETKNNADFITKDTPYSSFRFREILEGFAAILYPMSEVDLAFLLPISQYTRSCFASDDVTLSFALAYHYTPRFMVPESLMDHLNDLETFEFGLQEDANHQLDATGANIGTGGCQNEARYQACVQNLKELAWDEESQKWLPRNKVLKRLRLPKYSRNLVNSVPIDLGTPENPRELVPYEVKAPDGTFNFSIKPVAPY